MRKLEPGTKIIRHGFDRYTAHTTQEMTVVQSGKKKMLSAVDWYRGTTTLQPIRKESERMCYTKGEGGCTSKSWRTTSNT